MSPDRPSLDFSTVSLHALEQERLRVLAATTQFERTEFLVPIPGRSKRLRLHPGLQSLNVGKRNLALVDPLEKVLPQAAGKIRESDLRQLSLFQKRRESNPVPLAPFSKAPSPEETCGRRS